MATSIHRCHVLAFSFSVPSPTTMEGLLTVFKELKLPAQVCAESLIDHNILTSFVEKIGPPRTEKSKRTLLLCGGYLEEQIFVTAQHLLAKGYEVLLLRDLIDTRSPEHALIHDQRLLHAGAVSTTTRQLTYEWIATETDDLVRHALNELALV